MADNTKKTLTFGIDAAQISFKSILNKQFLELSMKVISSACPNRNNSWFTPESMRRSLGTFKNKPILGFFENDDFVSHDGTWRKDTETGMAYWDTLGKQGERIIGLIRSEDEVKIVQEGGLDWIVLTCALWTQYSFKQVKRLLKDAKRSQAEGGPTKNISVEVDLLDYEELPNGLIKINEFNLAGITILGSRNGKRVEPGIEGAELSVLDAGDKSLFERQANELRLAYEMLSAEENQKEENSVELENKVENTNETNVTSTTSEDNNVSITEGAKSTASFEGDICPECGKNPCECASKQCSHEDDDDEDDDDKDEDKEGGKKEQEEAKTAKPEDHQDQSMPEVVEGQEEEHKIDVLFELTSMTESLHWDEEYLNDKLERFAGHEEEKNVKYLIAVTKRILAMKEGEKQTLAAALAKVAEEVSEETLMYEEKLMDYITPEVACDKCCKLEAQCQEAEAKCADLEAKCKELEEKCLEMENHEKELCESVHQYEKAEFLKKAKDLIDEANLSDEDSSKFYSSCESEEIKDLEELKSKVAVAAFDQNTQGNKETFSAPVSTPTVGITETAEKPVKKNCWSVLDNMLGK